MTQTIKVSKSGRNVLTETDPNAFIFDSTKNTFKIIATGKATFSVDDTGGSFVEYTVAHNQNYIPLVIGFLRYGSDQEVYAPNNIKVDVFDAIEMNSSICADKTNVIFRIYNDTGGTVSVKVKYYIIEVPL